MVTEAVQAPEDILAAQRMGQSYMPRDYEIGPLSVASIDWPCHELSGDFLAVRRQSRDKIGFFLGDVTGHGIAAWGAANALVASFRVLAQMFDNPADLAFHLSHLCGRGAPEGPLPMVTAIVGSIDYTAHVASLVNAGHPSPIILDPARHEAWEFMVSGPLLGMMPEHQYIAMEFPFAPSQSMLFFTDGLLEATNASGEPFERTFMDLLPALVEEPSPMLLPLLRMRLASFLGGAVPQDDILVTRLSFLPPMSNL